MILVTSAVYYSPVHAELDRVQYNLHFYLKKMRINVCEYLISKRTEKHTTFHGITSLYYPP